MCVPTLKMGHFSRFSPKMAQKVKFSYVGGSEEKVKFDDSHLPSTYGDSLAGLSMRFRLKTFSIGL